MYMLMFPHTAQQINKRTAQHNLGIGCVATPGGTYTCGFHTQSFSCICQVAPVCMPM